MNFNDYMKGVQGMGNDDAVWKSETVIEPSVKNNLKFIVIRKVIMEINNIVGVFIDENSSIIFNLKGDEAIYFLTPIINQDNVIMSMLSDMMNNIYDDFAFSSIYEILCRKLFVYTTIQMCENYAPEFNTDNFLYKDVDLDCLETDCSTILCRIEFLRGENLYNLVSATGSDFYYEGKHVEEKHITFTSDDNKSKFTSMYNDWITLRDLVKCFEIYS